MDGQGKHVKISRALVNGDPVQVETVIEWTQELVDQRVKDEAKHWEKLARRIESAKELAKVIPIEEQLRILRKGSKAEVDALNATMDSAEADAKAEAARIRAEAPAKVEAVKAELEKRIGPSDHQVRRSITEQEESNESTEGVEPKNR